MWSLGSDPKAIEIKGSLSTDIRKLWMRPVKQNSLPLT